MNTDTKGKRSCTGEKGRISIACKGERKCETYLLGVMVLLIADAYMKRTYMRRLSSGKLVSLKHVKRVATTAASTPKIGSTMADILPMKKAFFLLIPSLIRGRAGCEFGVMRILHHFALI